jgi:hypothetical protein
VRAGTFVPMSQKTLLLVLNRALRTGLQAALGVVLAAQVGVLDAGVLKAAGVAALAAAVSALQNSLEAYLRGGVKAVEAEVAEDGTETPAEAPEA